MRIENTEVFGFNSALRGMRNAKSSWDRIDSIKFNELNPTRLMVDHKFIKEGLKESNHENFLIGDNDLKLAQTLIKAGSEHCKFMRQIQLWCDITMPRYWWSEADTYKIGTSANSTSTMHKLFNEQSKITLQLFEYDEYNRDIILKTIEELNLLREKYFDASTQKEKDNILKIAKQILPEGYLNMRTFNANYSTIRNMVLQRKNHRLKNEWQNTFCKWVTTLPYAKELIFCGLEDEYERLQGGNK